MQFKFTFKTVMVAVAAAASAAGAAFGGLTPPITTFQWGLVAWAGITAAIAAIAHDSQ